MIFRLFLRFLRDPGGEDFPEDVADVPVPGEAFGVEIVFVDAQPEEGLILSAQLDRTEETARPDLLFFLP